MCRLGGSPPPLLGEDINEIPPFLSHFSNLSSLERRRFHGVSLETDGFKKTCFFELQGQC